MSSELKIERWVERQFRQEVRAGRSVVAAADAVGVSDSAGKRWFRNGVNRPGFSGGRVVPAAAAAGAGGDGSGRPRTPGV
jgi:hypothetical protein